MYNKAKETRGTTAQELKMAKNEVLLLTSHLDIMRPYAPAHLQY